MFAQELELVHESIEDCGSYGSVMEAIDSEWTNNHFTRRVFVIALCLRREGCLACALDGVNP